MHRAVDAARAVHARPERMSVYKNNSTARATPTAPMRTTCLPGTLPFGDVIRHAHHFPGPAPDLHRLRQGRGGERPPRGRLPDHATGRLLRGGGGSRDHPEAPDHQHPRRAARRPLAATAASTSSSATPTSPSCRSFSSSARPRCSWRRWRTARCPIRSILLDDPVAVVLAGEPRPRPEPAAAAGRGRPMHRPRTAMALSRVGQESTSNDLRPRRGVPRPARGLGSRAHRSRNRPDAARRPSRLGGQAEAAHGYVERDGLPWDHSKLSLLDLQYHDVDPERALPPAGGRGTDAPPLHGRRDRKGGHRATRRRPERTSGATAWPVSGPRWSPPTGIRWCSTPAKRI